MKGRRGSGILGGLACALVSALIGAVINRRGVPFQHWEETFRLQADGRWFGGIEGTRLEGRRFPADLAGRGQEGDRLVWDYALGAYLILPVRYDRYRLYRDGALIWSFHEKMGIYYLTVAFLGAMPGVFLWLLISRHERRPRSAVTT